MPGSDDNLKKLEKLAELTAILPEYAKTYIRSLGTNYQIRTRIAYAGDLIVFFDYLRDVNPALSKLEIKEIPVDVLVALTPQDIVEYKDYLQLSKDSKGKTIYSDYDESRKSKYDPKRQSSSATINRRLAPLRALYRSLVEFGYTTDSNDPTRFKSGSSSRKIDKQEIIYLEKDEVQKVVDTVKNSRVASSYQAKYIKNTAKRDYALIMLLLNTGMRVSECVDINIEDLFFEDSENAGGSVIVHRKGGKVQKLFFNASTAAALSDYIKSERINYLPDVHENALFLSSQKKRMSVRAVEKLVKKFANESVNNGFKITPHKLRSTYGTALYDQTGDIRLVADVLGHEDITTTARHYAAAKEKHRREAGQMDLYE